MLDLAVRGSAVLPADYQGGAGIAEEIVGLVRRTRLDYSNLQVFDEPPTSGFIAIQDPVTGLFQRIDFATLPLTTPKDASVSNQKLVAAPARTIKGNATNTATAPQDLDPASLPATATLAGFMAAADKAKSDTLLAALSNLVAIPGPGGQLRVLYQFGESALANFRNIGGIWPGKVYAHTAFVEQYDPPTDGSGTTYSPASPLWTYAVDNGSGFDVDGAVIIAHAKAPNSSVFGANILVLSDGPGSVMRGLEIDFEPSAATTVGAGGGALYLNGFSRANLGPAIQTGGVDGGSWTNFAVLYAITGAGLTVGYRTPPDHETLTCLVDTGGNVVYIGDAIIVRNGHAARFEGPNGKAFLRNSGTLQVIADDGSGSGALSILTSSAANVATFGKTGGLGLGPSGNPFAGGLLDVGTGSNTEGAVHAKFHDADGIASLILTSGRGAAPNAAAATLRVNGNSATGRGISAGGTINAAGSDYAEYETKRADCGTVAKGQIIGFDADGLITDRFANAISFAVKSTDPSYVGGDPSTDHLGAEPEEPAYDEQPYAGVAYPGDAVPEAREKKPAEPDYDAPVADKDGSLRPRTEEERKQFVDAYARALAKWQIENDNAAGYAAQLAAYREQYAAWEATDAARRETWTREIYAPFLAASLAYSAAIEVARAPVDRIAYCGKVPVNVTGANPGDFILPVAASDGGIGAVIVSGLVITPEQHMHAIGRVRKVLADGRAEIVVKPI